LAGKTERSSVIEYCWARCQNAFGGEDTGKAQSMLRLVEAVEQMDDDEYVQIFETNEDR